MKKYFFLFAVLMFIGTNNNSAQGLQDFTLVNSTRVTIHHVYITQHDADEWGEDILGKDVFEDGEETDISFSADEDVCLWDLKIDDEDGNAIVWYDIDLCKWETVTLHWDGNKATATFD